PYQNSLKLERVQNLLVRAKIPYERLRAIHIAGTKGKGSTATFCAHILAANDYRVGLYTSPHFFDFRERIRILDRGRRTEDRGQRVRSSLISEKDVVRIVEKMRPSLEALRFSRKFGQLSFFEVYTAVAFQYFLEKRVDFVVLETGLGGRLDATNVVRPMVSIITPIGYDHTDKLGKSLSLIAAEKAGIIKKGVPLVCSFQEKSALDVFRKTCKLKKSLFILAGRDFSVHTRSLKSDRTCFDFKFGDFYAKNLKIRLLGPYQVENASLALTAIELLRRKGILKNKMSYVYGLAGAYIEGRFEIVRSRPLVVVDIAHNPMAFKALSQNLKLYFPGKKIIIIFAASRDKDARNMLGLFKEAKVILTTFCNPRAFSPQELEKVCSRKDVLISRNIFQAFGIAKSLCTQDSLIVISGSLFLASEAKRMIQKNRIAQRA
ncbi:MAG: bifunctional folylpolyglutamate synthase/dihydrofolate synthase, partial [Candidatus Omnitrophica bacterium]|nr:bifunctional folylpolyglutamate synthase/dihydrofolate synthase [Candidatus Omnitrophota bacterium]